MSRLTILLAAAAAFTLTACKTTIESDGKKTVAATKTANGQANAEGKTPGAIARFFQSIPSWLTIQACYTTPDGTKVCGGLQDSKVKISADKADGYAK